MMKTQYTIQLWTAALMLAGGAGLITLPGCGKAAEVAVESATEKAIEKESGGNASVDINTGDGTFSMTTGDGKNDVNMQAGEDLALPDDLPADVPLPDDTTWQLVQTVAGESAGLMLQGSTGTAMKELAESLKSKAEAQGWKLENRVSSTDKMEMLTFSKGEKSLNYTLGTDGDTTSVSVSMG